jgi:hypothetical protein
MTDLLFFLGVLSLLALTVSATVALLAWVYVVADTHRERRRRSRRGGRLEDEVFRRVIREAEEITRGAAR